MSRSDGQSEARPQCFKSPSKLGTHLSTHCSRDERLSRPCPPQEKNPNLWCGSAIRYHSTPRPSSFNYTQKYTEEPKHYKHILVTLRTIFYLQNYWNFPWHGYHKFLDSLVQLETG
ncbi:hypothetical protein TNCV_1546201 [Trichonephila clavipes]|nr:hypothetical protein TNCV_1546201 [Trichonephila clavipes]